MSKFIVELFKWNAKGLEIKKHKFDSAREAMDFGYLQPWDILKIYDPDGVMMHLNASSRENFQYA